MRTESTDEPQDPLVADVLSGERSRVLEAVWRIFSTRDPHLLDGPAAALPQLRAAADDADLGGLLASNNAHLHHVLCRLELYARGQCLCAAYDSLDRFDSSMFYDVEKEAALGHVTIVDTEPVPGWIPIRICVCTDCGRRFRVEEGDYHYSWWKWTEVEEPSDTGATERG